MGKNVWLDDATYQQLKELKSSEDETFAHLIERLMKKDSSRVEPSSLMFEVAPQNLPPLKETKTLKVEDAQANPSILEKSVSTDNAESNPVVNWTEPLSPNYFLNILDKRLRNEKEER